MEEFEFEHKKKKRLKKGPIFVFLCILCLVIGGLGGYYFASQQNSQNNDNNVYDQMAQMIEYYFLDTTDSKYSIEERMLSGMVAALGDKYTSYMTSDQTQELTSSINGSFEGIGVSFVAIKSGGLVLEAFEGSPAKNVGIKAGDIITHVQGTAIAGYDADKIKGMITGEKGTSVSIQVLRDGQKKDFQLQRGSVESSVGYEIKKEGNQSFGYLRITTFGSTTADLVEEALQVFEKANLKSICIDLRGNGGGYTDAARGILDLLLPEGEIMFQEQYNDNQIKKYKATDTKKYQFKNGYILTDHDTASASEIMTSALKEVLGYKTIGETTYGKGVVQSTIPLSQSSTLKITSAKWLTSKGNWIHEKGITPDYEVKSLALSDYPVYKSIEHNYQYDDVADEIKAMQKTLKLLGYSVDRIDGYFSQKTKTALEAFEKKYNLKVNGIYEKEDATILTSALTYYLYQKAIDQPYQKVVELIKSL